MTTKASVQNIFLAAPLKIKSISQQIAEAGGEGFNVDVTISPISGSHQELYTFTTPEGRKSMLTRNEFQVGMIDDAETHFVMYYGDTIQYRLVTPVDTTNGKILKVHDLGYSFEDMQANVQELWPNRVVWKFTHPDTKIHP
ncbi:hypothetical protein [Reinekea sp. G2M2-21]|uniref:hypothetical protein n=1 Tax=Reinekea sp. G2M2-21 TaxID=2788942 RepID=UPI0018AA2763|nr:hypothetical protein [Reinekea sp. G2M2-21]